MKIFSDQFFSFLLLSLSDKLKLLYPENRGVKEASDFGPRVLKTGISVTLALFICSLANLEYSVFAGVAAIFTIQPSIYRTWKQVREQIQANTLGALLALFALYFFGSSPLVIGVVVISVIVICLKLKMEASISLTLVTVLAIMSAPGQEDFLYVLNRFAVILIGIASAFIVNLLILPPKYKENFFQKCRPFLKRCLFY